MSRVKFPVKLDARPFILELPDNGSFFHVDAFSNNATRQNETMLALVLWDSQMVLCNKRKTLKMISSVLRNKGSKLDKKLSIFKSTNIIWQHYCKHPSHRTSVSPLSLDRPLECSSSSNVLVWMKNTRENNGTQKEAMALCCKYRFFRRLRPWKCCEIFLQNIQNKFV